MCGKTKNTVYNHLKTTLYKSDRKPPARQIHPVSGVLLNPKAPDAQKPSFFFLMRVRAIS
jgi:hypothetical protein